MKKFFEIAQIIILIGRVLSVADGLNSLGDMLMRSLSLKNQAEVTSHDPKDACENCKTVVSALQMALSAGMSTARILQEASDYCTVMNLQTPAVCNGTVYSIVPEVIEIMRNVSMNAAEVCYFIFDDSCDERAEHPSHSWNISLPSFPKPTLETIPIPKAVAPKLKVLHLTDTHYDPLYLVDSNADCPEPMCCRSSDGLRNLLSYKAAGKWGAFKCDLPKRTFEHALDFSAKTHQDIDYAIWTGDLVPHDIWGQTNDQLMQTIEESVELVTQKLPGIRIFPAIGNHERIPVNSFPTVEQDSLVAEFYNDINKLWSRWLPVSTSDTILHGAFYSTLVRPGFRIISLNTNVCYKYNFWLLQSSTDPMSQLQWLMDELQMAERANEKVHIIGHIPPGSEDCLKSWSHNYYEIIARYENTVTGQFFGHIHHDEIELFYDPENLDRATNIAYISPPLTPFKDGNPAFRIYYVDGDHIETTRLVVDYETWIMNLEEANLLDKPVWRKLYSAREAYAMQSLRPTDWNDCITKMTRDDELFDLYYRHYWRNSSFRPECLSDCKRSILCLARSGRSHDKANLCSEYVNSGTK